MYDNNNLIDLILLISSLLITIFGLLMLFAPPLFNKLTKAMDQVIGLLDIKILSNRLFWGFIMLISAIFLFYSAYAI